VRASGAMALGTILVGALGCMPPSIVGFPHPDPAPLGGTETSLLLFAGSGYPEMVDGGAGLSVAGRSGSTGWSITAWGGGGLGPAGFFGIHGEAALDLEPPTEAESARSCSTSRGSTSCSARASRSGASRTRRSASWAARRNR